MESQELHVLYMCTCRWKGKGGGCKSDLEVGEMEGGGVRVIWKWERWRGGGCKSGLEVGEMEGGGGCKSGLEVGEMGGGDVRVVWKWERWV